MVILTYLQSFQGSYITGTADGGMMILTYLQSPQGSYITGTADGGMVILTYLQSPQGSYYAGTAEGGMTAKRISSHLRVVITLAQPKVVWRPNVSPVTSG